MCVCLCVSVCARSSSTTTTKSFPAGSSTAVCGTAAATVWCSEELALQIRPDVTLLFQQRLADIYLCNYNTVSQARPGISFHFFFPFFFFYHSSIPAIQMQQQQQSGSPGHIFQDARAAKSELFKAMCLPFERLPISPCFPPPRGY